MKHYHTPEEHQLRIHRRHRQGVGLLVLLIFLIGMGAILRAGMGVVSRLTDDTEERMEFRHRLEQLASFDPLPFDGMENIDQLTLHEAAVWGTVYGIMETPGAIDHYERDPLTQQIRLPAVEVDAWLAKLAGKSFRMEHASFEMDDMTIEYDGEGQFYLIPITGSVGYYNITVEKLTKKDGKLYVTVGYIPVSDEADFTVTVSQTPSKYMDYRFEKTDGVWYLTGLTESAMQPEAAASTPAQSAEPLEGEDLENAIIAGIRSEDITASAPEAAPEEPEAVEADEPEKAASASQ